MPLISGLRHLATSLKTEHTVVHEGKTLEGNAGNNSVQRMSPWRIAAWAAATLFLLGNFVAMQFTDEVNWSVGDFVAAGILLFGALGAYEIVARRTGNTLYRTGVGVAIVAAILLLWVNGAVGITDSDADGLFLGVIAVGIIGALFARLRPEGMARTMFAMALAQGLVGVFALAAGMVPSHNSAIEILGITGLFAGLFAGSALLFREAARQERDPDAR